MRHSSKPVDLTGQTIGRWTVLERITGKRTTYLCRCECGTEKIVRHDFLRSGDSQSCGCLHRERTSERMAGNNYSLTHGHTRVGQYTREWRTWNSMMQRCYNPNATGYKYRGGRG